MIPETLKSRDTQQCNSVVPHGSSLGVSVLAEDAGKEAFLRKRTHENSRSKVEASLERLENQVFHEEEEEKEKEEEKETMKELEERLALASKEMQEKDEELRKMDLLLNEKEREVDRYKKIIEEKEREFRQREEELLGKVEQLEKTIKTPSAKTHKIEVSTQTDWPTDISINESLSEDDVGYKSDYDYKSNQDGAGALWSKLSENEVWIESWNEDDFSRDEPSPDLRCETLGTFIKEETCSKSLPVSLPQERSTTVSVPNSREKGNLLSWTPVGDILENAVLLGFGVYGSVYKVMYQGKPAAFKFQNSYDSYSDECFYKERKILEALKGAGGAPALLGYFQNPTGILMELCNGMSYYNLIGNELASDYQIFQLLAEIGRKLHEIHQAGYVHSDLKADNIIINTKEDGEFEVRIIDFGLATEAGCYTEIDAGSDHIYPPEYRGGGNAAPSGDVYSYGSLIEYVNECIFGSLNPVMEQLVKNMKNRNPDLRPAVPEVVEYLEKIMEYIKYITYVESDEEWDYNSDSVEN
ncbi:probable serine/threonine-protein kinase gdt2 [Palaemon carinicauda]|uniref:probable serine/threonine-protein kinase gdt2 n=1 Tax=Palaemon carinicauda TaxID=392227 RepID=UPI0035B5C2C6